MGDIELGNLAYLALLGGALVLWLLVEARKNMGRTLKQASAWVLIFVGVIAAIGLWGDIRRTVLLHQDVAQDGSQITLPRAPDGHYYLTALVNGTPVRFVVDTGASQVVLTQKDAENAGIALADLVYSGRANTANGRVRIAPVRLDSIDVDGVEMRNIRASVNEGQMGTSLLGMTYLERFSRIEIAGGALVLHR